MGRTYKNSLRAKKALQACGRVIFGGYLIAIFLKELLLIYTFYLVLDNIIQNFQNVDRKKIKAKSAVGDMSISSGICWIQP